ncbi:uncharacterized protein LOC131428600 [Malaya genurostris]|uniref:uncharacterized protein LOC131428600 n=1 Tax=Malaya genurostris TaxID=325434 RepID=UPI0026F3E127|nr:uncharacterized protein LOC131428600 [Malaya genurostris]
MSENALNENNNCQACAEADDERMRPTIEVPMASKSGSKAGSKPLSGISNARARKARLELEKLEAQKALAAKRLELQRRDQQRRHKEEELMAQQIRAQEEAALELKELQLEEEMTTETFRLRSLIELEEDDDDANESVVSTQSAFSKVRQWGPSNSTMATSTKQAPLIDPRDNGVTTTTRKTPAVYFGVKQPNRYQGVHRRELTGNTLGQSSLEPTLGGIIGRSESTIKPIADRTPPRFTSFMGTQCIFGQNRITHPSVSGNQTSAYPYVNPPISQSQIINTSHVSQPEIDDYQSREVSQFNQNSAEQSGSLTADPLDEIFPRPSTHSKSELEQLEESPRTIDPSNVRRDNVYRSRTEPQRQIDRTTSWGPTPRQLAARHVMAKELPVFSGNPEDWPLFISAYTNSTLACGFSDAENLARLQRCLRGHALESVRSRLLLPAGVSHVIDTLETLYGRPELLIHTLLQKIRVVPAPKSDRLGTLIEFAMAVQNLSDHLEVGRHQAHLNNPMLLFELVEKLPAHMKLDWSIYKHRCGEVNMRSFAQYMQTLVRAATDVTLQYDPKQKHQPAKEKNFKDKNFCGAHSTEGTSSVMQEETVEKRIQPPSRTCLVCKNPEHRVKDCPEFHTLTIDERWKMIQRFNLCRLCLGAHGRRSCKIRKQCDVDGCQRRHHPLLHSKQGIEDNRQKMNNFQSQKSEPKKMSIDSKPSCSRAVTNHHSIEKTTLFRIIPVTLYGNNCSVSVYAFLDEGSEKTLVDEDVVKQLGVVGETLPLCLQWTANVKRTEANSQRVALEIAGRVGGARHSLLDVRTVSKLDLPRQSLRYKDLAKTFPYLRGLPVNDYDEAEPRILIGNDNAHVTSTLKLRDGQPGEPIAAKSRLGWTVYGSNLDKSALRARSFHICECQEKDQMLQERVEQFFSIENLGVMETEPPMSSEVERSYRILRETTKRVGQRFETGLIWKYDCFEFPDSYSMAVKRLQCLERRMQKDLLIGESVRRQLLEYQEKGYIHKATQAELDEADPRRTWYLPLGVVINPKKPSKIRIFCDAAATVEGISLNTMLLKGPDLLSTLLNVLFGFREKRVALCADLMEMFHQIQIRKEDRHAQRLLWRKNSSSPPDVYLMDVATFGATCSPCSAHRRHYSKALCGRLLDSADDVEEAVKLANEVKLVHSFGGFYLRNWLSNSSEVLSRVGESESALKKCLQLDKTSSTERVLGLYWNPNNDVFTFSTCLAKQEDYPTKRHALRVVMSTFDPAGFLCFFLIHGKILIQDLWRAKTGWDESIPVNLRDKWRRWTELFRSLDQISIPRCYFPKASINDIISLQLHIYVDASEDAYACVGYLRAVFPNEIRVAQVGGKSKVAPLKAHSIPRLELMAAVIGVRFAKTVLSGHSLDIGKVVFRTDSKVVLAWINSDHRNYRQFVACRVGEILSKSKVEQWRWISTRKNVADEATKWGKGPNLSSNSRWFRGEDDLYLPEEQWTAIMLTDNESTDE